MILEDAIPTDLAGPLAPALRGEGEGEGEGEGSCLLLVTEISNTDLTQLQSNFGFPTWTSQSLRFSGSVVRVRREQ